MVLYHGSREIVEFPEMRKAIFNKNFYFQPRDYIAACYTKSYVL